MKFDKPPEGASNSSRKIALLFTVESTQQALKYHTALFQICFTGNKFEIWKISECNFCNVETVSPPGFQGLSCSKVQGFEGGLFQKLFKGYIFCFLGHLVGRYIFGLSTRETNFMKKRTVTQLQNAPLSNLKYLELPVYVFYKCR